MPTTRISIKRLSRHVDVSAAERDYLITGKTPPPGTPGFNPFRGGPLSGAPPMIVEYWARAWAEIREDVLGDWDRRGERGRPYAWEKFEAPGAEAKLREVWRGIRAEDNL